MKIDKDGHRSTVPVAPTTADTASVPLVPVPARRTSPLVGGRADPMVETEELWMAERRHRRRSRFARRDRTGHKHLLEQCLLLDERETNGLGHVGSFERSIGEANGLGIDQG
jgi:hypothetical protein